jgi:hypothetical protein
MESGQEEALAEFRERGTPVHEIQKQRGFPIHEILERLREREDNGRTPLYLAASMHGRDSRCKSSKVLEPEVE